MQTVTPGASHQEVTPIAYGTWQFGGDRESVDEQAAVAGLVREGLTRHVGVSNYSTDQITEFAAVPPAETVQPPYHLFRRDIERGLLPYARAHHIGLLAYGPLAYGPLGGTITEATTFGGDDWRSHSPAFTGPDNPVSSTLTRALLGWQPAHPGLIEDLDKGHYFHGRPRMISRAGASPRRNTIRPGVSLAGVAAAAGAAHVAGSAAGPGSRAGRSRAA